jgi:hypothetical protein
MTAKDVEFIVGGPIDGDHVTVLGRCGDVSVRVGDVFDAVYRYKHLRYPEEMGNESRIQPPFCLEF